MTRIPGTLTRLPEGCPSSHARAGLRKDADGVGSGSGDSAGLLRRGLAMRRLDGPRKGMLAVMAVLLVGACGSGDDTGPTTRLAIAKAATKSGDLQTGVTGETLPDALRIIVPRDGEPESGVTVTWSTGDGALDPASGETDDEGVSTSTWTLGDTPGTMTATASVTNAS